MVQNPGTTAYDGFCPGQLGRSRPSDKRNRPKSMEKDGSRYLKTSGRNIWFVNDKYAGGRGVDIDMLGELPIRPNSVPCCSMIVILPTLRAFVKRRGPTYRKIGPKVDREACTYGHG